MSFLNWFGKTSSKTTQNQDSQTFILEPILTPSGIVDGFEETPDNLDADSIDLPDLDPGFVEEVDAEETQEAEPDNTGEGPLAPTDEGEEIDVAEAIDLIPDEDIEEIEFMTDSPTEEGTQPSGVIDAESEIDGSPEQVVAQAATPDATSEEEISFITADETEADEPLENSHEPEQVIEQLAQAKPDFKFDSGVFTVGETGEIEVEYLFDGGKYQGEVAFFSLEGMEDLEPGSEAFIQEAAARALGRAGLERDTSNGPDLGEPIPTDTDFPAETPPQLGHIVISDKTEGAKFEGALGEKNWNQGEFSGVKTVQMRPGDTFGIMLVPNKSIQQVFDNPSIGGSGRPLFSLSTANPDDGFHVGQIADVTGDGNTFVMEDIRVDGKSDYDYNDIIFRIKGATGKAVNLDDVIDAENDWRETELGQALIAYTKTYVNPDFIETSDPVDSDWENIENSGIDLGQEDDLSTPIDNNQDSASSDSDVAPVEDDLSTPIDNNQDSASSDSDVAPVEDDLSTPIDNNQDSASSDSDVAPVEDDLSTPIDNNQDSASSDSDVAPVEDDLSTPIDNNQDSASSDSDVAPVEDDLSTPIDNNQDSNNGEIEDILEPSTGELPLPSSPYYLEKESVTAMNNALTDLTSAIANNPDGLIAALSSDETEASFDILTGTLEENPQIIELLGNPETLKNLGLDSQNIDTIKQLLQSPELAAEFGLNVTLGEALSHPDSNLLDGFLLNADEAIHLLPENAQQPKVGFIDFTQGNHIQQVTNTFASINPLANHDQFKVTGGNWADQLVKFVDKVKLSGENHGIANLSFDLSQLDDIGITTRYELTPKEQQAIQYARDNNVLLVVASGNTGNVMSALGQASQKFDNIITVGAVNQFQSKADYSAYGNGLNLMAPGGSWDDDSGAFVGTSRATAYVSAAASLVWAANPELSFLQVKQLLIDTAADLDVEGWDVLTGAGLVDIKEALDRATFIQGQGATMGGLPLQVNPFSGEGRVKTLARPAGDRTEQAIIDLDNTQQTLLEQWQVLADLGNPALTLDELDVEVKAKIAEAFKTYQQVSTDAEITTAQAQQWAEALALATQHYQIEQGRLLELQARQKELEEQLAGLGQQKTALEAETQRLLDGIKKDIAKAESDLAKSQAKLANPFANVDDNLQFNSQSFWNAAANQRQLAQNFRQQAGALAGESQHYQAVANSINPYRWQVVGSQPRPSGRRKEVWGWGQNPQLVQQKNQNQWLAGITAVNSQILQQLAAQTDQQAAALQQYGNLLETRKNTLNLGSGSGDDAVKVLQLLQEQVAQQQALANNYAQQAAIAEQRRRESQANADWHNSLINRWEVVGTKRGKSGRSEDVWGSRHYPEHIAPRDRAQQLAWQAAGERQTYDQLAQQAQQQANVLAEQARKLQERLRDWPVLKQGIEYEIAADSLRLQAEKDLLAMHEPVQEQKLETLNLQISQTEEELQKLTGEKLPAQQQLTDATEQRLQETQSEVEAIQQEREAAKKDLQNFLETAGFLLPYRERLAAVEKTIQQLEDDKLKVQETMQALTVALLQTPSETLRQQLNHWGNYVETLEQELDWAKLQKDQLALALTDSPERLAISGLIKELESEKGTAVADDVPLQRYIDFLRGIEGSGANFLEGFDNLEQRLAAAKTEQKDAEKALKQLQDEYRNLGLQKSNLEDKLIPAKEQEIKTTQENIAATETTLANLQTQLTGLQNTQAQKAIEVANQEAVVATTQAQTQAEIANIQTQINAKDAQIQQQQAVANSYPPQIQANYNAAAWYEGQRVYHQNSANYWSGQIQTWGIVGYKKRLFWRTPVYGWIYNPQAEANRNAHQNAANINAQYRDTSNLFAQQLTAALNATNQQINALNQQKAALVQQQQAQRNKLAAEQATLQRLQQQLQAISQQINTLQANIQQQEQKLDGLNNLLAQQQQQLADLQAQIPLLEQQLIDKYRQIELTENYLSQVEAEVNRLDARLDLLNRAGILEQQYQDNWQKWQQASLDQTQATEALIATRQAGESDRTLLTSLQSQLTQAQTNLQTAQTLQQNITDTLQAVEFSKLQLGNQQLLLQSLIDRENSLAALERYYLNLSEQHRQRIWATGGYNAGEAAAYRNYLEQASFIADQRNKLWQQRQETQQKINQLNQQIAQQQSQIATQQSQLQALGGIAHIQARITQINAAINAVNQRLQPLEILEKQQTEAITNAGSLTEHLTSELVQTAQLQATALRQLIGFGILASESDVDFFVAQVEPNVNSAIKKLREREQELTAQVQSAASRTATAQQKLANTTDAVSKQALTNLIARLQGQQSNLEALQAENEKAADELEDLLKQANDSLTPLRQKQELEIRQKLDSNDERLQALQSQLNSENAAENAIKADTVLAYAQLNDQIRQDLTLNASNWTQQLLDGNQMTKELGTSQQNLSAAVDELIAYINDNFADPHGEYNRSEADLRDGITTLGVLENRADELDSAFTSTEDAIERIKLRIAQDAALWDEIAPIAIRYGAESQEFQAYQQQYQAILAAKAPQLAQAQTLLTNAEAVQKQANAQSNLAQILSQQIATLKNTLPPKLRNVTHSVLSKIFYSFYGGVVNQINSLQQQLQAAQNQSAAFAQQATSLRQQADALKQQASQSVDAEVKVLRSTFLQAHPDNGTAIDLLQAATLEGKNPQWQISQQLNAPNADTLLNAPAVEGRNPLQALFDKSKAAQAAHEAQGYALLAQAAWYEQRAAYHWAVSRKNGPTWTEWRRVCKRRFLRRKKCWDEAVTHVDHDWIIWQQYSQIFPQLRQQGYAHLVEADKWRKEKERLEPLKNQWIEANDAANEANPVVKEARNFFAELEAARSDIPQAKTQQELLETLLPTLKQQLEEAEAEAAAQNAKVQQQWENYDTDSEEYRAAVADILQRRGELNKQSIETQQKLAESERWVEQQTVALADELAASKSLMAIVDLQRADLDTQLMLDPSNQELQTKVVQLEQTVRMLNNKVAVLTSEQTALTQKRTLLTAQNEVILAEQRLLDAYINDPDADTSNLEQQLLDARAALAEAQRLAEQAEAASKALTAPLQEIKADLLAQNDEHLKAAKEHQQILRSLVEATQSNANYTLQAAQKQQEVNNLEFQILQRLQQATAAGYQQAKHLLDVAQYNDMATAAEIYYRDYKDLASDRGGCAGGAGTAQDAILADQYYREMLNQRELQRRAQAQADAFRVAKETAEAQMNVLQQQQATAQQLLDDLNAKVAETQEQREQKQQELAIAQARLDGITRIREQTEQTFVQLVTLEKLNLAQAQLEQEIAQNRQADIDEAVAARQERDQIELERKRLETQARIEQLRQLQAEDDVRQNLNQVRSQLGLATLDATDDPVQLQTQMAILLDSLQNLPTQIPDLSNDLKSLLQEVQGDINLALQGKIQEISKENLTSALEGLIIQGNLYKHQLDSLIQEEQEDFELLQIAENDIQLASQKFLDGMNEAKLLDEEKQILTPLAIESIAKVAYANQAVSISKELAKAAKDILDEILDYRKKQREQRKKAFWQMILNIGMTVLGVISLIVAPFAPMVALGLNLVKGVISTVMAAINGDWMGAIFSGVMTAASFVSGALGNIINKAGNCVCVFGTSIAKSTLQNIKNGIDALKNLATGAYNGAKSIMSGDKILGVLQILGGLAGAATTGLGDAIKSLPGGDMIFKVIKELEKTPIAILNGIRTIQNGDTFNGISTILGAVLSTGKNLTAGTGPDCDCDGKEDSASFAYKLFSTLGNLNSSASVVVNKFIREGGVNGWLTGIGDLTNIWKADLGKLIEKSHLSAGVKNFASDTLEVLSKAPQKISAAIDYIKDKEYVKGIGTLLDTVLSSAKTYADETKAAPYVNAVSNIGYTGIALATVIDGAKDGFKELLKSLPEAADYLKKAWSDEYKQSELHDYIDGLLSKFKTNVKAGSSLKDKFNALKNAVKSLFSDDTLKAIGNTLDEFLDSLVPWNQPIAVPAPVAITP